MINRREVMAPVVDIRWWKLPYLEMRTYGSKRRKTISPPAWGVGGLLFHYRPEGGWVWWCMCVLGRPRHEECETGDSLGWMDSKILSSFHVAVKIPWRKQLPEDRTCSHSWLPGTAHHGGAVKVVRAWSSCPLTSGQEAEGNECLLLLCPVSSSTVQGPRQGMMPPIVANSRRHAQRFPDNPRFCRVGNTDLI